MDRDALTKMGAQMRLEQLDAERAMLLEILAPSVNGSGHPQARRGRPRKLTATEATILSDRLKVKRVKRVLSPEGRARIAAAQKARWAALKAKKAGKKR